jgi:hypothetical protein
MYDNGVIARPSHAGSILTVVFYPTLTVEEEDLARGFAGVRDALELVLA